jgi:hypothetical protein
MYRTDTDAKNLSKDPAVVLEAHEKRKEVPQALS